MTDFQRPLCILFQMYVAEQPSNSTQRGIHNGIFVRRKCNRYKNISVIANALCGSVRKTDRRMNPILRLPGLRGTLIIDLYLMALFANRVVKPPRQAP